MFNCLLLLTLAWGALAFGAEYSWAYAPLMVLCIVTGILGLRTEGGTPPARIVMGAFLAILIASGVQLLGPAHMIPGQGAGAKGVDFERLYALATMGRQPEPGVSRLSIAPGRTMLGMVFLASFLTLLAGCVKAFSAGGPRTIVRGIIILATVTAIFGIVQEPLRTETIYGFWRPMRLESPGFGPFANENHFAGWMAMTLALTIGAFAGNVSGALRNVRGWRDRTLWFSSKRASLTILTAAAAGVMALSMVLAESRGGLVGLALAFISASGWMLRRQLGLRRGIGLATLGALLLIALLWGGAESTIDHLLAQVETIGEREQVWSDAWRVAQEYPFSGTGLNTYGIAMLHYQTGPRDLAVIEAHNDYLQLAAEGGLLLGIPILFTLFFFIREIWRRFKEGNDDAETYWLRAGAVTGLLAIAGMEVFDFTLQMPGAAAMFVVLCAIAIHKPNHVKARA